MTVIDVIWFTGKDTIGIVAAKNQEGETKFLIGKGAGYCAKADAQDIADWGAKFDLEYLDRFLKRMIKEQTP